jgi:hypothetical protein
MFEAMTNKFDEVIKKLQTKIRFFAGCNPRPRHMGLNMGLVFRPDYT